MYTDPLVLRFPLAVVLALAEHAAAAPDHRTSPYSEATGACLVWVKDDGTYLMSNGEPHLPGPTDHHRVVHAQSWGPGTENDLAYTPVGGDDFAEYLQLTTPNSSSPPQTLLQELRDSVREGMRWLELEVRTDSVALACSS